MKKIIKTLPQTKFITIDEVESIKIKNIGIASLNIGNKGFLIPAQYGSELYWARAVESFGKGDGWDISNAKTLKGWIEYWKDSNIEFYYFDTPQELFKWLSE
jgi:hypothetical protein